MLSHNRAVHFCGNLALLSNRLPCMRRPWTWATAASVIDDYPTTYVVAGGS